MTNLEINYQAKAPQKYEAVFSRLLSKTKCLLKLKDFKVSVAIVGPAAIKKLNHRYRGKNKVTDVLSFEEVNEIIICLTQAKQQAQKLKRSLKAEMELLFVHGMLHLLGFDHIKDKDHKIMEEWTKKILN